jgi:RimJ/RimL family protein N-acetyltransferase
VPDPSREGRVILATARLQLREVTPADVDALAAMFADPEVMAWIGSGGVRHRDAARAVIERERSNYAEHGYGEWALTLQGDDEMIGLCGLIDWPDVGGAPETEIAYLLRRDVWGRGYATEATTAIRDHARGALGRDRLVCLIYHDNAASAAVARKLGMAHERDVEMFGHTLAMFAT